MADKLGSNPLGLLNEKEDIFSSNGISRLPCKQRVFLEEGNAFLCKSSRSRQRGALGNEKEAIKKCEKCHVREAQ